MNICNHDHPAISWESSDSLSCPMCSLIEEHQSAISQMQRDHEDEQEYLRAEASRWEEKYDDAQSEISGLENEVASLESDVSSLESEVSELQDQISELEAKQ